MTYIIMEKLDEMTPAYSIMKFDNRQEALWQIHRWEEERDERGAHRYPQWWLIVE